MKLKRKLAVSLLMLGGAPLIAAACNTNSENNDQKNNESLQKVETLLKEFEKDSVLADIYKESHQEYVLLKDSANKGENIAAKADKLYEQMKARKTIALISSGVLRPNDLEVQKNLDKLFETLGIEPATSNRTNVNSDGEAKTSGSLVTQIDELKDLIKQLQDQDSDNLNIISNVNAQLAKLQRLVDRATSSLLKRHYSPKEAALIAGTQLMQYIRDILRVYGPDSRYYSSVMQRLNRDTAILQSIRNTEVTSQTYTSLQQNLNDFISSFATYFRVFSSGHESVGPKVEPLATQPEEFMNELAKWRISLIDKAIKYYTETPDLQFRSEVTKEDVLKALQDLKSNLEKVYTEAQTFAEQTVIYSNNLDYFDIREVPNSDSVPRVYITTNRAFDVVVLYAKAGEEGTRATGDVKTLTDVKYSANPIDNVIIDEALKNIQAKAASVNAQITQAKNSEELAPILESVFYENQRKELDEFDGVDPREIKYLDIQTKSDFYAYLEDAKLSLENLINSLNSSKESDLSLIKSRIQALYSQTGDQSATGTLPTNYKTLVTDKISKNSNLQDIKTFYDAEVAKLKAMHEDTVAKAYDKYVAFYRLNQQIVALANAYNFFYDAGFESLDDPQLKAILAYPEGNALPPEEQKRVERRIRIYERNYNDNKAKYDFWIEHKAAIAIDVFTEGSSRTEALSASDDDAHNKELIKKHIGALKESLTYVSQALAENGLYGPSVEYVEATQAGLRKYQTIYDKYKAQYEKVDTLSAEEAKVLLTNYVDEVKSMWREMEMEYEYVEKEQVDTDKESLDREKAKLVAGSGNLKKVPGQEIYALLRKTYFDLGEQMRNNALAQYYNATNSSGQKRDPQAFDNSQGMLNTLNSTDNFNSIARIFVPAPSATFQGADRQPYVDAYNRLVTLENA
ncbi:Uncharacterised protein [Mycoplasmopsis columboralis]|uniref:Lipoprotein n=1 Tax=Mycoplasmopsis columboralis TaxID=171282 RepID=A0A449B654_9BACT|nr:hypothetical protein [Mycoplasmopsis columboralis]VEU76090.1 Uncharacterised protein [Mycoplasmopsis columboralis]